MFGLAAFAAPLIGNMLGGLFGGQGNQGGHGCHGHHHHHHHDHNNLREAAQDFRMARQDYHDAQRDFSQGNIFGGLSGTGRGQAARGRRLQPPERRPRLDLTVGAGGFRNVRKPGAPGLRRALTRSAASDKTFSACDFLLRRCSRLPLVADIVAKVENRATRKISRKLIFGLLRSCVAFQRHCGGS